MLEVAHKRFTVTEFDAMVAAGILDEDDRLELIEGAIIEMNPIGERHANTVNTLTYLLAPLMASQPVLVSVQNPIVVGTLSEPYPDVVLVRRPARGRREGHPTVADIFLVIEVSDTTLGYDRGRKVPLYARAGVPETWIVDVGGEQVFVYRQPGEAGYAQSQTLRRGDRLSPQAFPELVLSVDEMLG